MRIACLAVLFGCATAVPRDADWFPLDDGLRWTYEVRDGEKTFRLVTRSYGGDVRTLDGAEVPFEFVYGQPPWTEEEVTKSIYAAPADGPREFYLDADRWSLWHDPPIPLLGEAAVGARWTWRGRFDHETERDAVAEVAVEAWEDVDVPAGRFRALRVRADYGGGLAVVRWLAPGVGCVRLDVLGASKPRGLRLAAFSRD